MLHTTVKIIGCQGPQWYCVKCTRHREKDKIWMVKCDFILYFIVSTHHLFIYLFTYLCIYNCSCQVVVTWSNKIQISHEDRVHWVLPRCFCLLSAPSWAVELYQSVRTLKCRFIYLSRLSSSLPRPSLINFLVLLSFFFSCLVQNRLGICVPPLAVRGIKGRLRLPSNSNGFFFFV